MISLDDIKNPQLWRLAIQLDADSLRAVLTSVVEDASLINITLPLDPTAGPVKAVEEAVYSTPVLLADFAAVTIVVRTDAYTILPSEADQDDCADAAAAMHITDADGSPGTLRILTDRISSDLKVVWTIDSALASFLARTFRNPRIMCHISSLLNYFSRRTVLGNSGKTYVHFAGDTAAHTDIIAFDERGRLASAATQQCPDMPTAAFYILKTALQAGLSLENDEILLCGDAARRDAAMALLRRYAAMVMPAIFPSAAFRAGRDALKAPFTLIVLLCE